MVVPRLKRPYMKVRDFPVGVFALSRLRSSSPSSGVRALPFPARRGALGGCGRIVGYRHGDPVTTRAGIRSWTKTLPRLNVVWELASSVPRSWVTTLVVP